MNVLDYNLPAERIAEKPTSKRSESKLLHYHSGKIKDYEFKDITDILSSQVTLVLNETKVVNARIHFNKPTGGLIEVFCLEPAEGDITVELARKNQVRWKCMLGGAKKWKEGKITASTPDEDVVLYAEKVSNSEGVFILEFSWENDEMTFSEVLEKLGKIPLPPYIKRDAQESDQLRYQTVFAKNKGSVAAPTASLHFTKEILSKLQNQGVGQIKVNLHVGAGTFKPIASSIAEHEMHHELFEIEVAELQKLVKTEKIIAVGTTAVRTLESLFLLAVQFKKGTDKSINQLQKVEQWEWKKAEGYFSSYHKAFSLLLEHCTAEKTEKISGYTSLMIVPGFPYRVISGLITNFHMPKSTLLLLVSALIGDDWKKVYEHALENEYRFLSYGDSSLLMP